MYIQHPYYYDEKYFVKIDGQMIEVTKEVADVMRREYQNEKKRSKKWRAVNPEEWDAQEDGNKKVKYSEILDCVFSENAEGITMQDLPDENSLGVDEEVMRRMEFEELHDNIEKLSPHEQFIIKAIYFEGMKQKDLAGILDISPLRVHQKLQAILKKMRKMYEME